MPDTIQAADPRAFETALEFVLEKEGGGALTDDPRDPGGLTRWGISARAYPGLDIRNLTREGAAALYFRDYWQAGRCPELPPGVALLHFDTCVNQGVGAAAKLLQLSAGAEPDGKIGPKTLAAVRRLPPAGLLTEYAARRAVRYGQTAAFDRFGLGWSRRLCACLALGLAVTASG